MNGVSGFERANLRERYGKYVPVFVFSFVIYSQLWTNSLVNNYDGLWNGDYYKVGRWEVSIGRWFWPYLDRLRLSISPDPVMTIVTLCCFSIGVLVVLDLIGTGSGWRPYLAGALFLGSTAVCALLSYRYMSLTFGASFLFSVMAAWTLARIGSPLVSIIFGGILLALSMGLYQANIGCTAMVLIGYFICELSKEDSQLKGIIERLLRCCFGIALGGVLYVAVLSLHLKVLHMEMSSYKGGNTYSIINSIRKFPTSFLNTYKEFYRYFFNGDMLSNTFQQYGLYWLVFAVIGILITVRIFCLWRRNMRKGLLCLVLILLSPVACNAVLLIATSTNVMIQMTCPMALCLPVLLCAEAKMPKPKMSIKIFEKALPFCMALVSYGCALQTVIDQDAMYDGRIATESIMDMAVDRLSDEGYLDGDHTLCFVGRPADNPLFRKTDIFERANNYARFGEFSVKTDCLRMSYEGVLRYFFQINVPYCPDATYDELIGEETVLQMPCFPSDGSVMEIDGIVVVKISDTY